MQSMHELTRWNQRVEPRNSTPQKTGQNSHVGTSLPQLSGGHLKQPDLTAMGVEQHQTLPAHAGQLRSKLRHDANQQL